MPSPTAYPDLDAAYVGLLARVSNDPEFHISARGNDAAEIIGASLRLPDPRQRLPYFAARKANPVFHYAEALWYLAGRRDLERCAPDDLAEILSQISSHSGKKTCSLSGAI
jgi:thymidylate synthase